MRRIWATFPWWNEASMLNMWLEECGDLVHKIVLVEAPVTFGGDPKPLLYKPEYAGRWDDKVLHVVADQIPVTDDPWEREFAQRNAAWQAILDAGAALDDLVIICDVDEIPSKTALKWRGWPMVTLQLRTALFAADWLVPSWYRLPPMSVMATVRWLHTRDGDLAAVRQDRFELPVLQDGGWHFSWLGGTDLQGLKLATGTSHKEIAGTLEDALIQSGMRYTHGASGPTGAPVEPAVVDSTWPAYIRERRCPANWFRPEGSEKLWVKPAADDPMEIMDFLWSGWSKGALAFEVGANCGQSLERLKQRYGRVIGFEPHPPSYAIASMTPGTDVRLAAVSAYDGEVTLTIENDQLLSPGHEGYERLGLAANETVTVPCVTLDTIAAVEGIPDFVNMDVEGHELSVLQGSQKLLDARQTEWLIEFHSRYQQESCAKLLDEAGHDVTLVRHPHYAPGSEFYDQHGWLKAAPR